MARTRIIDAEERAPGPALPNDDAGRALTAREKAMLHGLSLCSPHTIRRWVLGLPITAASRERLEQAAAQIGIGR